MASDNIIVKNLGLHPTPNFNFMLRVEALFDLPCKAVRAFTKANEFEYIQEGGLNDYVHMRRKPITQPFTFEVDRYVGVDYWDPLPLGAEPILPVCLLVFGGAAYRSNGTTTFLRMYTFTGCTVMEKTYGELNAEQSGLYVETTKISYKECVIVTNPSIYDLGGKQTTYKEDLELDKDTNLYKPSGSGTYYARHVPGDIVGKTIYKKPDDEKDAANDNLNRGRYDATSGTTFNPKDFSKEIMRKGKFALTPANDDKRAERHLYSPKDDTHYAKRPTDVVEKAPAGDNMNKGRYTDAKPYALHPAAPEKADTSMNRGRYTDKKQYALHPAEPKEADKAMNRGRYSDSRHYASQPPAPKDADKYMNRGRYDTKDGAAFDPKSFTRETMGTNVYAREGSAPAPKAENIRYKEGDSSTMRHIDAATYLNNR